MEPERSARAVRFNRSGLCPVVGTNEKEGEGFTEGKGVGNRKQDYSNHLMSVSNRLNLTNLSGLFLFERRKGGDCKQSFSQEHFCSFVPFLFTSVVYV